MDEASHEEIVFEVDTTNQAVVEAAAASGSLEAGHIRSLPICDVTLVHGSRIDDEEENRFQMSVSVFGRELDRHEGGQAWHWGGRKLLLLHALRLQLVNVGSAWAIRDRNELGYPVCRICGQSASPLSSQRQRADFADKHQEWCSQRPEPVGFHADLAVDALLLRDCIDRREAFSLAEMLRAGATEVLDMDLEDLQVLVIGRAGSDYVDAILYDPMPGGSGLLEQILERFADILAAARDMAATCPSRCESSCIDCFRNYRNAFYHEHLDRHVMLDRLEEWGAALTDQHPVPARDPQPEPSDGDGLPVNRAEALLREMLDRAGFPPGRWQESFSLPRPLGSTTPDVNYVDPDEPGRHIFIYLDGLSDHIHGNPETAQKDREIRAQLRADGHDVLEITAHDLHDHAAMARHFRRLARTLMGREDARRVGDEVGEWFVGEATATADNAAAASGANAGEPASPGYATGPFSDSAALPTAAETPIYEPELYPAEWRYPLCMLAAAGVGVMPGADVNHEGGVVGSYVAELLNGDGEVALRVLDGRRPDASRLEQMLEGRGEPACAVSPEQADIVDVLLARMKG